MCGGERFLAEIAEHLFELFIGEFGLAPGAEQGEPGIGVPVLTVGQSLGELGPPAEVLLGGAGDVAKKIMAMRAARAFSLGRQQFFQPVAGRL